MARRTAFSVLVRPLAKKVSLVQSRLRLMDADTVTTPRKENGRAGVNRQPPARPTVAHLGGSIAGWRLVLRYSPDAAFYVSFPGNLRGVAFPPWLRQHGRGRLRSRPTGRCRNRLGQPPSPLYYAVIRPALSELVNGPRTPGLLQKPVPGDVRATN